jgi:DNA-binding IclR family transcriptional regulator
VLSAFPVGGRARGVTEVAKALQMKTSTVHRFAGTLVALGLLERDVASRLYRRPSSISQL